MTTTTPSSWPASNAEPEREIAAVEMLRSKRVDGVIVTSSRVGALYQEHLDRLGVPVVLINSHREQSGPYTFSVSVDNRHGGCLATEHLIQLGHRRIAYVSGPADHSDDLERLAGYREALRAGRHRLRSGPGRARHRPRRRRGAGAARAAWRWTSRPPPSFCYNDMTAIGLLRAARSARPVHPRRPGGGRL